MKAKQFERLPLPWLTIVGVLAGVLSCIVLAAALLFLTKTWPFAPAKPADSGLELKKTELEKLSRYEWIEKPAAGKPGVVRIPTDRAAELYLNEEARR